VPKPCGTNCPQVFAPVCASDGVIFRTFSNSCFLSVYNCQNPQRRKSSQVQILQTCMLQGRHSKANRLILAPSLQTRLLRTHNKLSVQIIILIIKKKYILTEYLQDYLQFFNTALPLADLF
jgi:hypothetical protein